MAERSFVAVRLGQLAASVGVFRVMLDRCPQTPSFLRSVHFAAILRFSAGPAQTHAFAISLNADFTRNALLCLPYPFFDLPQMTDDGFRAFEPYAGRSIFVFYTSNRQATVPSNEGEEGMSVLRDPY